MAWAPKSFQVGPAHRQFLAPATIVLLLVGLLSASPAKASVELEVSFHRQEHSLSCEIATLKMALAAHGIDVPEQQLIGQLPFDTTPKRNGVWGDPNKGFVGNIDGRMLVDGYGVYWDPIARIANTYTQADVVRHGSASELAAHLQEGNPVIIWGYYGRRAVYNWNAPDGTAIKAVNGEHTRVVYGFDGTPQNPTRFYLIDPLDGHLSWSTDELMYNWSALNHMGVVVKPPASWVRIPGETAVWELNNHSNTRHWVVDWDTFITRGGTKQAVKPIAKNVLLSYIRGSDIN